MKQLNSRKLCCATAFAIFLFAPMIAHAGTIEGFTEPYRQVAVPAAEVGVIARIVVAEGAVVKQGEIVAQLDDTVLRASLEVAKAAKEATGSIKVAEAELDARLKIVESYKQLSEEGNASQREFERALNDQLKAAAGLQSAQEELDVRRLEYERVKAQISQRLIVSPINGHVVAIDKDAGEFVSPTDPVVMHIVQLDTLKSVFSVPRKSVRAIRVGQNVQLTIGYEKVACTGMIEFISPTADPQSGTVRVKVRIPNADGRLQSGSIAQWELDGYEQPERITTLPMTTR